ncbi:MAG: NAD(P)-dependent oxidoreductase [Verrucomicrobia bacterium]|nr:NAD(P)-dependent oxidoreductase [Verrucomicrobiota bacterium]MBV9657217.1 NAD(P)-dependent oxidoreductase [Verrucomicrobiota bacterium]
MNILLTGGTGFIGAAFLKLALARGHRVAALARAARRADHLFAHENLVWLHGSLADAPFAHIAAFAPQTCVHAAWIATPVVYLDSPENDNYLCWSLDFLDRAREAGARHLVVLGTCIEYEIPPSRRELLSEITTPVAPASRYARAKNALRLALESRGERTGDFQLCWARVFYPYGPGEHPDRLCSTLLRRLQAGEKIVLKTPASTKDYIFIDDLAAALLRVVETEFAGDINLGTGVGTPVSGIAAQAAALCGRPELIAAAPATPSVTDPLGYVVADASRLRALGWQPAWDFARGLERLHESLFAKAVS